MVVTQIFAEDVPVSKTVFWVDLGWQAVEELLDRCGMIFELRE